MGQLPTTLGRLKTAFRNSKTPLAFVNTLSDHLHGGSALPEEWIDRGDFDPDGYAGFSFTWQHGGHDALMSFQLQEGMAGDLYVLLLFNRNFCTIRADKKKLAPKVARHMYSGSEDTVGLVPRSWVAGWDVREDTKDGFRRGHAAVPAPTRAPELLASRDLADYLAHLYFLIQYESGLAKDPHAPPDRFFRRSGIKQTGARSPIECVASLHRPRKWLTMALMGDALDLAEKTRALSRFFPSAFPGVLSYWAERIDVESRHWRGSPDREAVLDVIINGLCNGR